MKIRRYVADSLQEAVKQARLELGRDAMIIHTRKFKQGGFFGLFARPRIEITVALDEEVAQAASHDTPRAESKPVPMVSEDNFVAVNKELPEKADELLEELREMKQMMADLNHKLEEKDKLKGMPRSVQSLYKALVNNQVNEKLAFRIAQSVKQRIETEEGHHDEDMMGVCTEVLGSMFKKPKPIEFNRGRPRVVAMIGPTGVGKTTTIAKLAANFALLERKRVGLVTIDTYRIAAVEQLKTYAEIIGVPLEVVFHPEGLETALAKHKDKDVIFIDTAGRSPRNEPHINELAEFLRVAEPDEILLVLSTNTPTLDLLEIYQRFNVVRIDKLVFTKVDECERFGQILNVAYKTKTGLAYITNGQNVPDDIMVPDPSYLAKMILGEVSV
ncbi:MAG TPA: flagellar biosynthesis protein FlhF [Syntrophothermus lipocalidus]|uniref:flagellar biosynthesis protein FlhF n=1 Tax=Syntrophothermus sp. TaxID=2736299 RepID=UPI00257C738A|nr:flagellar biosynthesis protein FlhF [Syntrophothermus sp.]NSW82427.1 flagellar biosynthesis protein FlhF [Syntrophothermus sp.]HOV42994.1 flagellar biosynthesis protein FlhF [Syntrophothermus lipocalidus]